MIVILDFGSQYNQLIARKVRALGVPAQILPCTASIERIRELEPKGLILSGGPASVHAEGAPQLNPEVPALGLPILGICYGMQALAHAGAGQVKPTQLREYGQAHLLDMADDPLFVGLDGRTRVWMSHRDSVVGLPEGWHGLARTENCPHAVMRHNEHPWWGLQFHPEVHHTEAGETILANFAKRICGAAETWHMDSWVEHHVSALHAEIGERHVVAAVSGGVDSTVMASLLHRAIGERLTCVFIDNGLLRLHESEEVMANFERLGIPTRLIDAGERFLSPLQGVEDPEAKRKIIGRVFIEVLFEQIAEGDLLAQGTLYPDVIESVSTHGPSATIKTHHNRVPEVLAMMEQGRVVEPMRELFKDEVRQVGAELGIPREILWRHPFPGPGLAVRILGDVTPERLAVLRPADRIFIDELRAADLYFDATWQAFAVLLPVRSVGVMGDERTYENVVALRAVTSTDGMTADWARLPHEVLARVANRIINEVEGVNRVVYDVSSKPPSTIEWE
ncbi:glutamine-hydrolyzing GMP synthase [Candidatus Sumerlaeota bacterium]|nr:glutamine-hydrolyzing GMP synthase [Candidatus Sumerlaeota bacterium]